jgi:hypothetical protein
MENNNTVRVYGVIVGLQYYTHPELYAGDTVEIAEHNFVYSAGHQIGALAANAKFYDQADDIMEILTRDGVVETYGQNYIIIGPEDIRELIGEYTTGTISYVDNKIAIVYLGDIDEDELYPEEDLFYCLTDKGYDYLTNCDACGLCDTEREDTNMDTMFGRGFGKCTDNRFALSMNGIAVRQAGSDKFVVYDKENNEFVDSTNTLLDIKDALVILPTVELSVGDLVIHEGKPYYIIGTGREIKAVSYDDCTQTILIPKTTLFGIKYFTKVYSIFGDNFAATGEIFNNPMMLMSLINGDRTDMSKLLMFNAMSKGDFANNPMAMAFLMNGNNDGDDFSKFAMLSMMTGKNPFATKAETKVEE